MGVACLPLAVGDRSGGGGASGTQERLSLSQSRKEAGKIASTNPQRSQLGFVSAKLLRLPRGWREIQSGRASGQAWVSLAQNQCYVLGFVYSLVLTLTSCAIGSKLFHISKFQFAPL